MLTMSSSRKGKQLLRGAALGTVLFAVAAHAQQADRIAAQFDPSQRVALQDHLPRWATLKRRSRICD
jgi:hypothetical protein